MPELIYIVFCQGGQWEDSWSRPVRAFKTEPEALAHKEMLENNQPEYSEYYERLLYRIDDVAHIKAISKNLEDSDEYWGEFLRIKGSLVQKLDVKYPNYTHEKDYVFYTIDVVEMEE